MRLSWRSPADEPREYALQFRTKGPLASGGALPGAPLAAATPSSRASAGSSAEAPASGAFHEVKGVSSLHYTLRGLTPATRYEVRVVAVNALGRGPPSEPLPLTTLRAEDSPFDVSCECRRCAALLCAPPPPSHSRALLAADTEEAPRALQVRPLSSTTLLMQWEEPPSPSGLVTGYRVYFTTQPLLPLPLWSQQVVDDSRLSTVSGLTPHQVYWVRVQALTPVGAGPPSVPALVKTQQGGEEGRDNPTPGHPGQVPPGLW